jgi:ribosomal protein S18 acetylase RimI-like enzyme
MAITQRDRGNPPRITQAQPYLLERATALDYDFIYGVARTTMHDYVARIWGWDEAFQSARFQEMFIADEWQLVTVDKRQAGCLNVQFRPLEIFLANIYLLPDYQRRGIGSSIIRNLLQIGVETGLPIRLNVLTSNHDAYRLYVRLGFHVVEESSDKRLMST